MIGLWLVISGLVVTLGSVLTYVIMARKPWLSVAPTQEDITRSPWQICMIGVPIGMAIIGFAAVVQPMNTVFEIVARTGIGVTIVSFCIGIIMLTKPWQTAPLTKKEQTDSPWFARMAMGIGLGIAIILAAGFFGPPPR